MCFHNLRIRKHAPDILIFTPHVIHSGASDLIPIDSSRSDDEPIVAATGAASIFTSAFLLGAVTGAAAATGAAGAFGVSAARYRCVLATIV
jgi:hypothetical protein